MEGRKRLGLFLFHMAALLVFAAFEGILVWGVYRLLTGNRAAAMDFLEPFITLLSVFLFNAVLAVWNRRVQKEKMSDISNMGRKMK